MCACRLKHIEKPQGPWPCTKECTDMLGTGEKLPGAAAQHAALRLMPLFLVRINNVRGERSGLLETKWGMWCTPPSLMVKQPSNFICPCQLLAQRRRDLLHGSYEAQQLLREANTVPAGMIPAAVRQ